MKEEGLEKSLIDLDEFVDKPFYPYKNFFPKYLESFIHPPTLPVKINTYNVMKKVYNLSFRFTIICANYRAIFLFISLRLMLYYLVEQRERL